MDNLDNKQTGSVHIHLVSDSTGETLLMVSRAVTAQYANISVIEHLYPLIRNRIQLESVVSEMIEFPGIVLYTLIDEDSCLFLEQECQRLSYPVMPILEPIHHFFRSCGFVPNYRAGAQHSLNAEYFKRIDALNFVMMHDDGQQIEKLDQADIVLVGVSRTSKTPTCIYLANRGVKAANIPLVPGIDPPPALFSLKKPLIVGLLAAPERIVQIRQNRLLGMKLEKEMENNHTYVDKFFVAEEMIRAKRLFLEHHWPVIDVTRRSIEETAAAVLDLLKLHVTQGVS